MMYGIYGGYSMGCPPRSCGITMEMKRGQNATNASKVKTPNGNNTKEKTWQDRATMNTDSWTHDHVYYGDGQDQADWFDKHTNVEQLIQRILKNSHDADQFYSWAQGMLMGSGIYGEHGWDSMSSYEQQITKALDKYFDKSRTDAAFAVRRLTTAEILTGERTTTLAQLKALVGKDIYAKGHLSTGAAKEGLSITGSGKQVELVMHIPKDAKGTGMWIGDSRINPWGRKQREYVINRDTIWNVGKVRYNKSRGVYEVDVYFKGRRKHDYGGFVKSLNKYMPKSKPWWE